MEIKTFEQARDELLNKADEVMANTDFCWIVVEAVHEIGDCCEVEFDITDAADEVQARCFLRVYAKELAEILDIARRYNESMERGF